MPMRRTKIIATLSKERSTPALLRKLIAAGMDAVRINTAHASLDDVRAIIRNVRAVSSRIAIILDTKGPEIRTTKVSSPISVTAGMKVVFRKGTDLTTSKVIQTTSSLQSLSVGDPIYVDDGLLEFDVVAKRAGTLICVARNDGALGSSKSINVPNARIDLPSLSEKDKLFVRLAIEEDADFIAHSFVRNVQDVRDLQKLLGKSSIKIIAKIENAQGVANIDSIIKEVYGVMVARGDLAVEIPTARVPLVQKYLIRLCMEQARPVITATQMLHSMIQNPRPTRAEVSDVANAILDGTDALMLSGETAQGKYPVESVEMLAQIAKTIESEKHSKNEILPFKYPDSNNYLARTAAYAHNDLPTKAIVIATTSGHSVRVVSRFRGSNPIFAKCFDERVMRELSLVYGVSPSLTKLPKSAPHLIREMITSLLEEKRVSGNDLIVLLTGIPGRGRLSTTLDIVTVNDALQKYR